MIAANGPAPPAPLPELNVTFIPGENGVEQLVAPDQDDRPRVSAVSDRAVDFGQAGALFRPAHVKKKADGAVAQPLFVCALDDTPWTSEDEAVAHVLKNHFATFYQAERTATEPPKGVYTFVAQCGMSGVILGPPNYHDYQNQLRKLHAERFRGCRSTCSRRA